ncbi:MAG: TIGR04086 family membrane protein [Ruminococcaceae bacterium]|nr:TIGR04086 family membrane protein [Oscillospiraceae bacterium]
MRRRGKRGSRNIITQLLVAMPLLTFLLAFVCAKMIVSEILREESIMPCVYTIVGFTSFLACLYCAIRMPQKKALWGIATAGVYAAMLLLGNLLFFGVGYGQILPIILTVLGAGFVASMLGAMKRRKYA